MSTIELGIGESVTVRVPTQQEQQEYGNQPVLVVHHPDRDDDVMPASDVVIAPRSYGVLR